MSALLRRMFTKDVVAGPSQRRIKLLVVEEDGKGASIKSRRLTHMGYDVVSAEGGTVALSLLKTDRFEMLLIDAGKKGLSGVATLRKLQASGVMGDTSTLLITASDDAAAIMIEALNAGADDVIAQPLNFDVLDVRIRHILARARCVADLKRQNQQLDARVARRAVELGEARMQLETLAADRFHVRDHAIA